jgi:hypothetical protein
MKSQRETILRESPARSEEAGDLTLKARPSEIHSAFIGVARLVSNCARRTKFLPVVLSTPSSFIGSNQSVLYCAHRVLNAFISTNDPSKLPRSLFRDVG